MPLVIGFVELLGSVLLLTSAVTGASFADVIKGRAGQIYRAGTNDTSASTGSASAPAGAGPPPGPGGHVNPVPGATGGRLDQGFDVTGGSFLSPFAGKVVYSSPSDPGWAGGGYVAIADALDPKNVIYFAEGLIPTVNVGDTVTAGQEIATPATNPYNGIVGNIEFGPANPASPGQPLAQVVRNPAAAVLRWYHWILSLGGPTASSIALAGHP